jgi:hypothetical protein
VSAQCGDARFQVGIEHVANHDHAAGRPLSEAAKIRMAELRHGPPARDEGLQDRLNGFLAHGKAARCLFDDAPPPGR